MARKKSNKLLFIVVGIAIFLIIFVIIGKSAGWIGQPAELEVELAKAKKATIIEKISASGAVQPEVEVKLSPDVAGEIIELNVAEGDSVPAGKLLVKIRPDNFISALDRARANYNQQLASLAQSKANLQRAEALYTRTELSFKRNEKLYKDKVISDADFEQARADFQSAKNDLEAAKQQVNAAEFVVKSSKASVDEAQENLRLTNVYAPVSGIVSKLLVEKGERVVGTQQMAGTEMLRIANLQKMEVRVNVNENDIVRISVGDTAIIDVDSYTYTGQKFKGVVTQVSNSALDKASQDAVTEFEVRVSILNDSYASLVTEKNKYPFRPGMTASVDIITNKKVDILSVPLSAVTTRTKNEVEGMASDSTTTAPAQGQTVRQSEDSMQEVIFINDGGKAKIVKVKTGISDFENIEILEGVTEGQEVISGPFFVVSKRIKNGDLIKAMPKGMPVAGAPAAN